uniref:Apyrase n=1 Tax=Kalanchoe fedtschenkoi TaxID=63787 RepID=A0A7N0TSN1_KALFE
MRRRTAEPPAPSPSMDSAAKLHLRPSATAVSKLPRSIRNPRLAVIAIAALLLTLAASAYLIITERAERAGSVTKFRIVIDGGSTGTRIHVLRYEVVGGEAVLDFKRGLSSLRVNPGLSSYAEAPGGAGESLAELIEFGKGRVPRGSWARTEIRLMATAGMRLLDGKVQEEILESCREVLRGSGFMFKDDWASVISGSDEGKYAWVAANHALGSLGGDPLRTTGIIELGGASAQVTFVAREPVPSEFSHSLQYGNYSYNLYSHSFLHFGQNVAHDSLREALISVNESTQMDTNTMIDPCAPKGHSHEPVLSSHAPGSLAVQKTPANSLRGEGDFSQCRSAALALLKKGNDQCSYQHCQIGSAFVPKLHGRFLATENFFFTSKFFRLSPKAKLSDLMRAGEQYCREDWSVLKKKYHPHDDDDLLRYCFSSAYIVALLNDSLGISLNDERISFTNQVRGAPLDWALGAFILQSSADLEENRPNLTGNIVRDDSPTLLALIVIFLFLLFMAWTVSKWKKPQLKTIYDLEKGRYIVTRVGK